MRARPVLLVLCLIGAGCEPRPVALPAPGAEPQLSLTLIHEDTVVRPDGVTATERWRERFTRARDCVWTERVLERPAPNVEPHDVDWATVPHLVRRDRTGAGPARLELVLASERVRVVVEPPEFDSVDFSGDWSEWARRVPSSLLSELSPDGEDVVEGRPARWLAKRDALGFVRVLWSDELAVALALDVGRSDGSYRSRTWAAIEPAPLLDPCARVEGFRARDISDYRD